MHFFAPSPVRSWRVSATILAIIALLASSKALALTTVGVGTTLLITTDTTFAVTEPARGRLEMDGGQLRVSDGGSGQALTVTMDAALLKRGTINNPHNQTGVSQLIFNFNTELAGGPAGSAPTDVMYIRASSFDSRGFQVINNGTFVQDGLGRLVTQGPVQFNNRGIFDIRNDLGFQAGDFSPIGFKPFFNTGLFKKTGGQATSFVNAIFHQDGGVVSAQSGSIAFTTGGFHQNAGFLANPIGGNPNGQIALGGAHTFTGTVITYNGGLIGTPAGSSLDVNGAWDQRAFFVNGGDVRVSESGIWANSGSFLSANGRVSGSGGVFGVILNTGSFSSSVVPTTDQFGNEAQGLKVINRGTFTVNPLEVVRVRDFVNENGRVIVNGRVENVGGTFQLLGGVLGGVGVINGDTFVGGGPLDATFRPGSSTGTMTIDGAFSLLPGGVLELEVERDALTGSVSYDQVIANSFFIDGHIRFLIGAGVAEADVLGLRFLHCGGPGGACSTQYGSSLSYDFPGRPGSTLSLGEHGIQISALAPVPEPAAVAMLLAGLGVLGVAVRRRQLPNRV